jgi:hypothetical protein
MVIGPHGEQREVPFGSMALTFWDPFSDYPTKYPHGWLWYITHGGI